MKIFIIDNSLWSLLHFRGRVVKALSKQGHKITVIAPYENLPADSMVGYEDIEFIYPNIDRTSTSIKQEIKSLLEITKLIKNGNPDFIITYTIKPTLFTGLASFVSSRFKHIAMLAGTGQLSAGKGIKFNLVRFAMKRIFQRIYKLILLNDEDYLFVTSNFCNNNKCILFESGEGLDIDYYKPANDCYSNSIKNIVMIGRLLYSKGYQQYIDAAKIVKKQYQNIEFYIAGYIDEFHPDGVPKEIVMKDVAEGNINYLGTTDDVRSLLNQNDLFVLPSFYNEGMNRSLMEAISMGKIVISTNNKGCKEMVNDGVNGFLIEPKSTESLVDAIYKVIRLNSCSLLKMQKASRNLAITKFSDKKVIETYINLIR